jgi:hypothetical protein
MSPNLEVSTRGSQIGKDSDEQYKGWPVLWSVDTLRKKELTRLLRLS